LRTLPDKGIGYGVLRHFDPHTKQLFDDCPQPQIVLNYLGRFNEENKKDNPNNSGQQIESWMFDQGGLTACQDDDKRQRMQLLDINAMIDPEGCLRFGLAYCKHAHDEQSALALANAFTQSLITLSRHCLEDPLFNRHTPSDFELMGHPLTQSILDTLVRTYPTLEDIVPLTALQQGLAFESLSRDQAVIDPYHVQMVFTFEGEFDAPAMQRAVQQLILRHKILRLVVVPPETLFATGIILDGTRQACPLITLEGSAQQRLAALCALDISHPFKLSEGPLFRACITKLDSHRTALLISNHHLVLDGWSTPLLLKELARLYEAETQSLQASLPRPFDWKDHLNWLKRQPEESALTYWREHLATARDAGPLLLPIPKAPTLGMGDLRLSLDVQDTRRFDQAARESGLTPASALQGLFGFLMSKLSRTNELIIGSVRNGRGSQLPNIDQAIGLFIDTLPLALKLTPQETLVEWLREQQDEQAQQDAYAHLGLARIQKLVNQGQHNSQPLFEALFIFENYSSDQMSVGATSQERGKLTQTDSQGMDGTHYPISLIAVPGEKLLLRLTFDKMRLSEHDAQSILNKIAALVSNFEHNREQVLANVMLMTHAEHDHLLSRCGMSSATKEASQATLLFANQFPLLSKRYADRTALLYQDQNGSQGFSYSELVERSSRLARALIAQGVGPGTLVAILLHRSPDMLISLLAIQQTGAAYLPLDPDYPVARLQYMLNDSQASCLLSHSTLTDAKNSDNALIAPLTLLVDDARFQQNLLAYACTPLTEIERLVPLTPDHLCYVIYTSGSTGQPKGVGLTHRNLAVFLSAAQQAVPLTETDRLLAITTIGFDIAVLELYLPLVNGAAVVLLCPEHTKDPLKLKEAIAHHKISVMQATPSLWELIISQELPASNLRMLVGGEALPHSLAQRMLVSGSEVINMYGPTEATVWASTQHITLSIFNSPTSAAPIGQPMADYAMYVLDDSMSLVPDGVVGELYIAGPALAQGYINRPSLTAERFIACPFGTAGRRMYRSGDLVRRRADGIIDYLSRADDQIKLRGYRIELGEIDASLRGFADIEQAATIASSSPNGQTRLVSYVVLREQATTSLENLRVMMRMGLPSYMVPDVLIAISSLPLTPNGKLDRRSLPAPEQRETSHTFVAPVSQTEVLCCELFAEITGFSPVGLEDNFFEIGGQSLLAMRLIGLLRQRLGVELPMRTLFESPTPKELAQQLLKKMNAQDAPPYTPLVPLRKTGSQPILFCIHPAGGSASVYGNLTQALGQDQPIWALQARGLEAGEMPHTTMQEVVAEYVTALRQVEPVGPYRLLGTSLGGMIAHAMVAELERQGSTVDKLILVDTATISNSDLSDDPAERAIHILKAIAHEAGIHDISKYDEDSLHLKIRDHMASVNMIPAEMPLDWFKRMLDHSVQASRLTAHHTLPTVQAPILLVKATLDGMPDDSSIFDWSPFTTNQVKTVDIEASHSDILWRSDTLPIFAQALLRYLGNA
jgi:amino acid adenylation domain-containing protein/non-ribosomal peptide synthase protein (TIGR01720 family)